jgi:hypothetical protein
MIVEGAGFTIRLHGSAPTVREPQNNVRGIQRK